MMYTFELSTGPCQPTLYIYSLKENEGGALFKLLWIERNEPLEFWLTKDS